MWSHGAFDSTKVCHRALTQACSVIRWLFMGGADPLARANGADKELGQPSKVGKVRICIGEWLDFGDC